ncbi:glycerol dehydratase large subunit [Caldanaerobius fijiensis DSM 17918]|uniref:Glycerol dehydratase large subunit n=1 Tax=Caldanaerobius fijiensis DSM 17918 TaxID=1121256 RepID=A0A1M4UEQ6_9THEO|nr:propanediol/glycerol family dehydratase large subunit [Caldanaerobius fijiensis]SHE55225.1 glycerol dehydratase large subunit [Caldanaerobius fijiensis DSM 17918]
MKRSKRFQVLDSRPINNDAFMREWPEKGFIAMESLRDPKPSIKIENGVIVELDGKKRDEFDFIDEFIADNSIDISAAINAMNIKSIDIAKMLVDVNVSRREILNITRGLTPAKILEVVNSMNVVEMMMAMQKMRARKIPSIQAHVTNLMDNPVLIAADAAEGALRGFDEEETTVGIARYAPLNALALLVGSQTGRGGVLTQCAVEEATELNIAMRGLTSYAETISVYGTEGVFIDGDDTPFSKAFLASAYASRGLKIRFTSGTGSEVLMGDAEGKSMLYLEIRCIMIAKGAGVQGIQNGSISCIGVTSSVPSGIRAILAENLVAAMLDLEVASGNDQTFSHSDIRRTAKTMLQFLPGTDFIFSGYSATPNYDNMFAGSNFDVDDYDDYNVLQRDLKVDGGLRPVSEEEVIMVRNRAARALKSVFTQLGLPPITNEEVEKATYAHGSKDMPERDIVKDLLAIDEMMKKGITGLDVVKALYRSGFEDIAENILNMLKQRVSGDYLQTSSIIDKNFNVISAVNCENDYRGPGTGYIMSEERWNEIKAIPHLIDPDEY